MSIIDGVTLDFQENHSALGELASDESKRLGIPDFAGFESERTTHPFAPHPPIPAIYDGANERKRVTFEEFNREKKLTHQRALVQYEKKKRRYDLLNLYAGDLAGYGRYLLDHFPHVLEFFGPRRPLSLSGIGRRFHAYLTGGTGSGKSTELMSFAWDDLAEDRGSLVFIDPHNDVSERVAMFRPNAESGRLVYVFPRLNDDVFPGLNPFDIPDKENLSDIDAESYAGDFMLAFREILGGNITDQMETVLQNTIPVLIKLPGASVYDLIQFLRPKKQREPKAQAPGQASEYAATKYVEFAKANFSNVEMLGFLTSQFEDDSAYVSTRNALTTRLMGVFGSTLMQALFRGARTIRLEELVPQRKAVVFNLSGLGRETGLVGRFVLISLKLYALSRANLPARERVPCHVIVDECQRFVTESMTEILQEARKFGVFLTMAQQSPGGGMSDALYDAVTTNAGIRIAGFNSGPSVATTAKEMGVDPSVIPELKTGQFVVSQRDAKPRTAIVRRSAHVLRKDAVMGRGAWNGIMRQQVSAYYRRPATLPEPPPISAAGGASAVDLEGYFN